MSTNKTRYRWGVLS